MPDLMTILANLSSSIGPIIQLLQAVALLIGLWMTAGALIELWGVSNENALKFVPGKARFSVGGAIIQLVIGAVMLSMGTLEMVGILSRTLTTDYANSRFLSYTLTTNTLQDQALAAMAALLGIMQVVGFVAMTKGWLTINAHANGRSQHGPGVATAWLIAGLACWNFKWCTDVLNCTLGYNVIGIFMPLGAVASCS